MYTFTDKTVRALNDKLNRIVPIRFETVNSLSANAEMECQRTQALIHYRNSADEHIDILHELLHVQMFYKDGFSQLAWRTGDHRITNELEKTVKYTRDIIDDTYVFYQLYTNYSVFPISPIFFDECEIDCQNQRIGFMERENGINKTLVGAWRLRMAELVLEHFKAPLRCTNKKICRKFIKVFAEFDSDVKRLLNLIRQSVKPENMAITSKHAEALEILRDHFGYSSDIVYLAKWLKINDIWDLRRI